MAFYRCEYILRTGEVCGRGSYRPEGCGYHWKSPQRIPCKECGKFTSSTYGMCEKHAGKHRNMNHYYRKKLEKMVQDGESEIRCSASSEVKEN